jgi:hypothetical protein
VESSTSPEEKGKPTVLALCELAFRSELQRGEKENVSNSHNTGMILFRTH